MSSEQTLIDALKLAQSLLQGIKLWNITIKFSYYVAFFDKVERPLKLFYGNKSRVIYQQ